MSEVKETELVCVRCVRGRKILSSTVIPVEERNHAFAATLANGGPMPCDECGHRHFTLYTVRVR